MKELIFMVNLYYSINKQKCGSSLVSCDGSYALPKNNLNLCIRTYSCHGWSGFNSMCLAHKPNIFRSITKGVAENTVYYL